MAEESQELEKLGEFGLIEQLTKPFKLSHASSIKGVGDDAAILKHKGQTVVTTDLLVEGIHFNLIYTPLKHLGYKSVVVNLSDVYAMNAVAKQIVVGIAVSQRFDLEDIEQIYEGIQTACEAYGIDLVGGDTTSSLTGLTISITAIGEQRGDLVQRDGAKNNDLICVSGDLGAAYMGLQLLERERKVYEQTGGSQPQLDGYDYVLSRQLKPEARKDVIDYFHDQKLVPTSMIDISDGLSSEIMHLCQQSGTGCRIYDDKVPVDSETTKVGEELGVEGLTAALNGGEDYELLFTFPIEMHDKIDAMKGISIIGHMTALETGMFISCEGGQDIELKAQGWKSI